MPLYKLNSSQINYLFIDGGCLRETLEYYSKRFFSNTPIEFNYGKLSHKFEKIFYYDSHPAKKNDESKLDYENRIQPFSDFLSRLNMLDGFHVYEGSARRRRKSIVQKKVDIMIAVDMLNHAFRKNMTIATLLTSDLDFKPLIDAMVDNGMHIRLWHPTNNINNELIQAADSSFKLNLESIHEYSTNDFQKEHPIPSKIAKVGIEMPDAIFIEPTSNKYGLEGRIYEINGEIGYRIVYPTNYDKSAFHFLEFSDLDILKEYFDEFSE